MIHLNKFDTFINEVIYPAEFRLKDKLKDLVKQNKSYRQLLDEINTRYKEDKILFLDYHQFIDWFKENDLDKTYPAPPPGHMQMYPGVVFAAHFPEFKEVIVVTNSSLIRNFDNQQSFLKFDKEISSIIKHEQIHTQQAAKKDLEHAPNADVSNPKDYLSHPDEVMAMANTAAYQIFNKNVNMPDDLVTAINNTQAGDGYIRFFNENDPVRKRFLKYVYQYLDKLYNKD